MKIINYKQLKYMNKWKDNYKIVDSHRFQSW